MKQTTPSDPSLVPLALLVGEWKMEAPNMGDPAAGVQARVTLFHGRHQ